MKMRKITAAVLAGVMIVLSGCGGNEETGEVSSVPEDSAAESVAADLEVVTSEENISEEVRESDITYETETETASEKSEQESTAGINLNEEDYPHDSEDMKKVPKISNENVSREVTISSLSDLDNVENIDNTEKITLRMQLDDTADFPDLHSLNDLKNIKQLFIDLSITGESVQLSDIADKVIMSNADITMVLYLSADTDISCLSSLDNLKALTLTKIPDIYPNPVIYGFDSFRECKSLKRFAVDLDFADPDDVYVLNTMPQLEYIGIDYDAVDFTALKPANLKGLGVRGTVDMSELEHLTTLTEITLEYNDSTDLSPIEKFKNLEELNITECGFTDYESILKLDKIKRIFISSAPMTREMYDKLIEKTGDDGEVIVINSFIE